MVVVPKLLLNEVDLFFLSDIGFHCILICVPLLLEILFVLVVFCNLTLIHDNQSFLNDAILNETNPFHLIILILMVV